MLSSSSSGGAYKLDPQIGGHVVFLMPGDVNFAYSWSSGPKSWPFLDPGLVIPMILGNHGFVRQALIEEADLTD